MRLFGCREIGYGVLVECVLGFVILKGDIFFYVIWVVLEVFFLNGLIFMGLVCVLILGLMDVGVFISKFVSGVVMGLIKEDEEVWILMDI